MQYILKAIWRSQNWHLSINIDTKIFYIAILSTHPLAFPIHKHFKKHFDSMSHDKAWISYILFLDQNEEYIGPIRWVMQQIASIFVFTLFFVVLLEVCQWFLKKDNSIVSKWYQNSNDMSVCQVSSLRVSVIIALSFNKMRRLYSLKFKKEQRKNKELKRVCESNFENSRNFPRNFQFG